MLDKKKFDHFIALYDNYLRFYAEDDFVEEILIDLFYDYFPELDGLEFEDLIYSYQEKEEMDGCYRGLCELADANLKFEEKEKKKLAELVNIDSAIIKEYSDCVAKKIDIDSELSNEIYRMADRFYDYFPKLEGKMFSLYEDIFCAYLKFPWKNFDAQEIDKCYRILKSYK